MRIAIKGEEATTVEDIIDKPERIAMLLSKACMGTFHGDKECTSLARDLDYLAYWTDIQRRSSAISQEFFGIVGNRKPGEIIETKETED